MNNILKKTRQLKLYFRRKWKKFLVPLIVLKIVKIGVIVAITFLSSNCYAGKKAWVFFKDKAGTEFNPYQYFDKAALERRVELGLSLSDSTDFPVNDFYKSAVINCGANILTESRWLNAVSVNMSDVQKDRIAKLSFVADIQYINSVAEPASIFKEKRLKEEEVQLLKNQINALQGNRFISKQITGKGIRIAIFDAGFPNVDKLPYFKHIRNENRIIKTYDFVDKHEYVYAHNEHGTMTFSCIAGLADSLNIGLATGAEFLLARTETWTEFLNEEEYWLEAVEWADKNGARIISSSLGYTYQRYHQRDMNGRTSLVSKAALMAARKGILVVNAMGNDGRDFWQVVSSPADADSVLSVGGINPETGFHINFSSYGPTADKRMKPNVSAFGKVVAAGEKNLSTVYGTSFSTPLTAGFAACVLQMNPKLSNMQLLSEIEKSASLYPYFDYAHGFGIPQAGYFVDNKTNVDTTFDVLVDDVSVRIRIREKAMPDSGLIESAPRFYYNISKPDGTIRNYFVVKVTDKDVVSILLDKIKEKEYLRFHYQGFTRDFHFKTNTITN